MLKCDPRAFAQCPGHKYCGSCATDATFMEGSECDKFNQSVLSKPMTNADRIRAMSDEALAEFLESTHSQMAIKLGGEYIVRAKEYIGIWLKQPAEVDGNA